jgi:UV DNA damage endonuclease
MKHEPGPRLGLCCAFVEEPIHFRRTTAKAMDRLPRAERLRRLSDLALGNAKALESALSYCDRTGIGCFRVNSQILPLKTHPELGYEIADLPESAKIVEAFQKCGGFAAERGIRTTFHPDQFVVLGSPRPEVMRSSLQELEYQAEVAEWIGADVINVHGGGAYGDKALSLRRFAENAGALSSRARSRLTVENDDRVFTPADLLPLCRSEGIPLVYDVHHHRCRPDGIDPREATDLALETWDREPLFHVSSPRDGWKGPQPSRHHDYVSLRDFPRFWDDLPVTVEVEAKAKEKAVSTLMKELERRRQRRREAKS